MRILKTSELLNIWSNNSKKFAKLVSYKTFFLNVNRRGIYFIWMRLKRRKAKLKQRVKVSFLKALACFTMILDKSIRYILKKTTPLIFRIPKNISNLNTPSRCFNFSFSIEGHSNLNCLQRMVGKSKWKAPLWINSRNYNKI